MKWIIGPVLKAETSAQGNQFNFRVARKATLNVGTFGAPYQSCKVNLFQKGEPTWACDLQGHNKETLTAMLQAEGQTGQLWAKVGIDRAHWDKFYMVFEVGYPTSESTLEFFLESQLGKKGFPKGIKTLPGYEEDEFDERSFVRKSETTDVADEDFL